MASKKTKLFREHGRFFSVPHYIMDAAAWRFLSPTARAAWLEFCRLYNGSNNGRIGMPARGLAKKLNVSRATAARAIVDPMTYGFLEIANGASYSGKRRAAEYLLTHLKDDRTGDLPTRTFQNIGKTAPEVALIADTAGEPIGSLQSH
jgi:hypothetical protein